MHSKSIFQWNSLFLLHLNVRCWIKLKNFNFCQIIFVLAFQSKIFCFYFLFVIDITTNLTIESNLRASCISIEHILTDHEIHSVITFYIVAIRFFYLEMPNGNVNLSLLTKMNGFEIILGNTDSFVLKSLSFRLLSLQRSLYISSYFLAIKANHFKKINRNQS